MLCIERIYSSVIGSNEKLKHHQHVNYFQFNTKNIVLQQPQY